MRGVLRTYVGASRAATLLIAMLLSACTDADKGAGTLTVREFDCETQCWRASSIDVPRAYWGTWLDADGCDDMSLTINYDGVCVLTSQFCQAPDGQPGWYDDPAVGEVVDCCGGLTTEEQASLSLAEFCSE